VKRVSWLLGLRPFVSTFLILLVVSFLYGCSASPGPGRDPAVDPPDTASPTAPSSLTATASSSTQIGLTWAASTDNVGVTGYRIERCSGANCTSFAQIATSATSTFADSGLSGSTSYSYRVRATDAAGNLSSYSNTASASTSAAADTQAPTAPSNLMVAASSTTQISLTWNGATDNVGVTGYRIERCSGASCTSFAQIGTTTGSTSFNDTGLAAATSYSYRVRAADAAGNLSPYSNTSSASTSTPSDTQPPSAPSSLVATSSSSSQIGLTWAASTDNVGVTGYHVERCSGASCTSFTQIGTTTGATTFNDTGLAASTSYSYRVRANDAAGNLSGYSNTSAASTSAAGDTQAPTAPSSLAATASSSSQVGLTWAASTDNVGVTGYRIERCSGASCTTFAQVGTTTGATTFNDTGLTASTAYRYRVRANDGAGNLSGYSNIASATTSAASDTQAPTAPSNLAATASSSSQIGLTWTASTDNVGVTGYRIERCSGASCTTFAQIGTTTGATTFNDTGLTASTAYRYRVRANDAAGNLSAYSNIASATTSAASDTQAPTAPSNLVATASSSSQVGLTWTASTDNVGVTGYRIERCSGASCTTFAQIGTTTGATTFNDTGLTASTSYSYRVRANDAAGNLSAYSNIASATTSSSSDTQAPTAPSNLSATASSSSQIGLTWTASTDNVGVTGYRIERCSGASCTTFTQIGTTTGATTFSDTGLTASTSYSYRVRANDAANNLSAYSNTSSATTSASGGTSITVSVSPKRGGITTSQTLPLSVTLTNDTGNQGVTWSFTSTASTSGGSFSTCTAPCATVTFTAPSSAGVVTITATAVGDATKSDSATIGVTDLPGVLTYHNNLSRDGTNLKEYALTTSNVTTNTFGKLFSCTADGALYAQPLWVPKLSIGGGTHNIIIVASMRDTVYAFDADKSPCITYWSNTLIPSGETYGDANDVNSRDIYRDIVILGTPVIDTSSGTIFLVSKTKTSAGIYHQRLHALSLATGAEKLGGPVDLTPSITVAGTGDTGDSSSSCSSSSGQVPFCPLRENQRPALALSSGVVYVSWASHGDQPTYHGWIMGFSASTLARVSTLNVSPNGRQGGIWMSGGAPAVDSNGNIYAITGNGDFDGVKDFGDSVLKLSSSLSVDDFFTPGNQGALDSSDLDFGSGGAVVLADLPSSSVPHILIGGGKGDTSVGPAFSGTLFVLDRDNLGGYKGPVLPNNVLQSFSFGHAIFSTPAFWQNTIYIAGFGGPMMAFSLNPSTSLVNTAATSHSGNNFTRFGATPSISSLGSSNGIVWAIDFSKSGTTDNTFTAAGPAVLHAYDASNLATELWNSSQGTGNTAGNSVKFTVPTVANGKVYVGTRGSDDTNGSGSTFGEVDVYGLLP